MKHIKKYDKTRRSWQYYSLCKLTNQQPCVRALLGRGGERGREGGRKGGREEPVLEEAPRSDEILPGRYY